jgi:hypothetical protein
MEGGMEEREAREKAPSIFEEVKEIVQRFMILTVFNRTIRSASVWRS